MSSGADGSAPGPDLDPGPGMKLDCEPPLPQAPAPQQEVEALRTEAPAPAPQQEAVALQTEALAPAPQQEVMPLQTEVPAQQQEVVALRTEAPAPAPQLEAVALQTEALTPAPQQEVMPLQTEVPAPQKDVVALRTEAPAPAPPQQVMPLQTEPPPPALQQEVMPLQTEVPAPQKDVVALQTEAPAPTVTIVISRPGEEVQAPNAKGVSPASTPLAGGGKATATSVSVTAAAAAKEAELARSDSFDDYEQCRVCQQKTEEPLVDLGCRCRGDLAKAHRTCIDVWFRTRGSNKCEICQQVAVNIPPPEMQASTSYWVWRVDSTYGRGRGGHERGWFSPLWVAFAILIGGLLLDVLISVSLGVSALPVNIIIGVLIVLGLGTALRLALECCQEWGSRRNVSNIPRLENIPPTGYHPAVV